MSSWFDDRFAAAAPKFAAVFGDRGASVFVLNFVVDNSGERVVDNEGNFIVGNTAGAWVDSLIIWGLEELEEVFDTGTDDLDFDVDLVDVPVTDLPYPIVTGRDGVQGTRFKRGGSDVEWFLRKIVIHGRSGGGFHRFLVATTDGPMDV